ncbi:CDP-alcohol phosphatidyltransferase family protein [Candidatus Woesearchaeota archaeon]|nr:CDP-alcohol phosphatidyltransferase family protein [Candidatus Woesearchaeota archaeon]
MISLREVVERTQLPKEKQSFFMYYYYRRISRYITWVLVHTSVTPNQVTFAEIFTGILASVFLAFPDYTLNIIGAILLQLWFTIDCVDGEIARFRNLSSQRGGYLDGMGTNIIRVTVFLGLGYNAFVRYDSPNSPLLFLAGIIIFSSILVYNSFLMLKYSCLVQELIKVKTIPALYEKYHLPKKPSFEQLYKAGLSFGFLYKTPSSTKKTKTNVYSDHQPFIKKCGSIIFKTISTLFYFNTINFFILISALFGSFKPLLLFYALTFPILVLISFFYQYFYGFHSFMKQYSETLYSCGEEKTIDTHPKSRTSKTAYDR